VQSFGQVASEQSMRDHPAVQLHMGSPVRIESTQVPCAEQAGDPGHTIILQALPVHPVLQTQEGGFVEGLQVPLLLQFEAHNGISQFTPLHPRGQEGQDGFTLKKIEKLDSAVSVQLATGGAMGPFCVCEVAQGGLFVMFSQYS